MSSWSVSMLMILIFLVLALRAPIQYYWSCLHQLRYSKTFLTVFQSSLDRTPRLGRWGEYEGSALVGNRRTQAQCLGRRIWFHREFCLLSRFSRFRVKPKRDVAASSLDERLAEFRWDAFLHQLREIPHFPKEANPKIISCAVDRNIIWRVVGSLLIGLWKVLVEHGSSKYLLIKLKKGAWNVFGFIANHRVSLWVVVKVRLLRV